MRNLGSISVNKQEELIAKCIKENKTTKQTIYRYLRYWQLGKSPNALSAIYENCGGSGKTKERQEEEKGRRRTRSLGVGVNVDENIKDISCLSRTKLFK